MTRLAVASITLVSLMLSAPPATAASPAAERAGKGASVQVVDSRYGKIVVDGRGFTLYAFTRDRSGRSRCYGACAQSWPSLYARGEPQAFGGAQSRRLGTTERRDGRRQVTYGGNPLYYYVGEDAP